LFLWGGIVKTAFITKSYHFNQQSRIVFTILFGIGSIALNFWVVYLKRNVPLKRLKDLRIRIKTGRYLPWFY
jgi:hypothetical protein